MAITNGYCSLADLKGRLRIGDSDDDSVLEALVEGVSRWIDETCGRVFYESAATVRYYTAAEGNLLEVDDLQSVDSLEADEDGDRVYERTWAATDYDLMPFNAATDGKSYTWLETTPNGNYAFPTVAKGVKITGTWGWAAVPKPVKEACLLMGIYLWERKDAVLGVLGTGEFTTAVQAEAFAEDMMVLLRPFMRRLV